MSRKENRINERKKRTIKYVVILYILLIFVLFANKAMAKFLTFASSNDMAKVAKFSFVLKDNNNQILSQNFEYDLSNNVTGGNLISTNGIAPGKSGKISMIIDVSGREVKSNYEIFLKAKQSLPQELKFYSDEGMTNEITLGDNSILTGSINANETQKNIYWKWNFNENTNENEFEGKNFLFDITVNVIQTEE
jgi:hypothetical protein